eukprot:873216-Rhodomonas_salina.2
MIQRPAVSSPSLRLHTPPHTQHTSHLSPCVAVCQQRMWLALTRFGASTALSSLTRPRVLPCDRDSARKPTLTCSVPPQMIDENAHAPPSWIPVPQANQLATAPPVPTTNWRSAFDAVPPAN